MFQMHLRFRQGRQKIPVPAHSIPPLLLQLVIFLILHQQLQEAPPPQEIKFVVMVLSHHVHQLRRCYQQWKDL